MKRKVPDREVRRDVTKKKIGNQGSLIEDTGLAKRRGIGNTMSSEPKSCRRI